MTPTKTPPTQSVEKYNGTNPFVIFHLNHKRINQENDTTTMKKNLLSLAQIIGITNPPSNEFLDSIVAFLQTKYNDFTFPEIKHAFMLYASGDIGDVKKENSTFNAVFIGSLLNQYRIMRKRAIERTEKEMAAGILEEKKPVSYEQHCLEHWNTYVELIRKTKQIELPMTRWDDLFSHLESIGELKDTNEQKESFKIELKNSTLGSLWDKLDNATSVFESNKFRTMISEINDETYLRSLCRKMKVIEYVKQKNIIES